MASFCFLLFNQQVKVILFCLFLPWGIITYFKDFHLHFKSADYALSTPTLTVIPLSLVLLFDRYALNCLMLPHKPRPVGEEQGDSMTCRAEQLRPSQAHLSSTTTPDSQVSCESTSAWFSKASSRLGGSWVGAKCFRGTLVSLPDV